MADSSYLGELQNFAGGVLTFVRELANAGDVMAEFFDRPRLRNWVVKFRRNVQELIGDKKALLSQLKAGRPPQRMVPDIDRAVARLKNMKSLVEDQFDSNFASNSQGMPGAPSTAPLRARREELKTKFTDQLQGKVDALNEMKAAAAQGKKNESITKLTQAISFLTAADKALGELINNLS